jgi:hypothetical protein
MAVGGLPSKRQGRLGRPKDHRRPRVMAFFIISHPLTLHLHLLPSSPFPPFSFFFNSFSFPACSLSFSLSCPLSFSLAYSLSCPFLLLLRLLPLLLLLPRLFPLLRPLLSNPLPLFCLQHLVRPPLSQAPRSHPTGPGSIPAYPYKAKPHRPFPPPFWPRHRPHPVFFKTNPRQHLSGWNRGDGFRLTLRNLP